MSSPITPSRRSGSLRPRRSAGKDAAPGAGGERDVAGPARGGESGRRIALVRADSPVGRSLARVLLAGGAQVVDLTDLPTSPPDVTRIECDPGSPGIAEHLRGCQAVVHSAAITDLGATLKSNPSARRAQAVREAQALVTASAAVGVRHVVVVTSAMVYGARAGHPVPLPEDTPVATDLGASVIGDLPEVEAVLDTARAIHPGLLVTSVRPAALVGNGADTIITRHFEAPRLLVMRGREAHWQFCHVEDLATAVDRVLRDRLAPVVTVSGGEPLSQAMVERISGLRRVELPASSAYAAAERLHRLGVLPSPASDLDFISHPWVVGAQALRAAGWRPAWDNEASLSVLLDGVRGQTAVLTRRFGRMDVAAIGAASAAVAVGASAALLRRSRGKGA